MKKLAVILFLLSSAIFFCSGCFEVKKPAAHPRTGELIWHGDLASKDVYLTFDDGPTSEATAKILDILKKHHAKATFFILGRKAERSSDIVRRIKREGHDIGNHTYSHAGGLNVNYKRIKKELEETDAAIKRACGSSPKFFRPPFGFFNYRYFTVAEKMGYKSVLWTIDAGDWNELTSKEVERRLIPNIRGGYIVLIHDGGPSREAVIDGLPVVIDSLRAKGFHFKPLSALLP